MSEPIKVNPIVRKALIRGFYFAEAMAVYDRYYRPLVETYGPARQELTIRVATKIDLPQVLSFFTAPQEDIKKILQDVSLRQGKNGTGAFTEIPIGELDRMKYRHHGEHQVAIGFPRRYIESLGLTPVWYLKHNPEIWNALEKWEADEPQAFAPLKPFIDQKEDVAPFQEIRTTEAVDMEQVVWLLTKNRDTNRDPVIPGVDSFQAKHGKIAQSYWHRSHQMGILSEWQFTKMTRDERGVPVAFQFRGEYYWRKLTTEIAELSVTFPAHDRNITFEMTRLAEHEGFTGPWRFIDVARSIARVLVEAGEDINNVLRYRLIQNILAV
jgi:hypothetical protein